MNGRRLWTLPSAPEPESIFWDRAFRFGMSVFETVAVQRGRPLFLSGHLERLREAAHSLMGFPAAAITDWAHDTLLSQLDGETGVARVYCTAGMGGLTDPVTIPCGAILYEAASVVAGPGNPISATIDRAPIVPVPGGWKTGNYWQNIRSLAAARAAGFDDAILCDPAGRVIGSSTGNIFASVRGRLVTPALETGARPGVVREWVISRAGAMDEFLSPSDLHHADEVFITNSRVGILSVGQIDGHTLVSHQWAGPLSRLYLDEVLEHR